jgi:hypothetical protein
MFDDRFFPVEPRSSGCPCPGGNGASDFHVFSSGAIRSKALFKLI